MEASENKLFSRIAGFFLPIFTPGHLASKFTLGTCLGIFVVGVMNLVFAVVINQVAGWHIQMVFGPERIALWVAADLYILTLHFVSKGYDKKLVKIQKSVNAESSAKNAVRRAA